jgi:hypothetical protein
MFKSLFRDARLEELEKNYQEQLAQYPKSKYSTFEEIDSEENDTSWADKLKEGIKNEKIHQK